MSRGPIGAASEAAFDGATGPTGAARAAPDEQRSHSHA